MYKIYTGCMNVHLQDHCENNSIITDQQAAGEKKAFTACRTIPNQQMILNEVKYNERNLYKVWLN